MATECKHGRLARSCEICELEAENERLQDGIIKWIETNNAATTLINEQQADIKRLRIALEYVAEMSLDATTREAAQSALDAAGGE